MPARNGSGASARISSRAWTAASSQFGLARRRHEKLPKGAKALALVRVPDDVLLPEDLVEQPPLALVAGGDALSGLAVEAAKVVLHLAEVGEEPAGRLLHLKITLLDLRRIVGVDQPGADAADLGVYRRFLPLQFGDAFGRVQPGFADDLPQQFEDRQQA